MILNLEKIALIASIPIFALSGSMSLYTAGSSQSFKRRLAGLLICLVLSACASLPQNLEREASFALRDTETTQLGESLQDDLADHPGLSGFYLLDSGLDAYVARAVLAYSAERSIDAQYYLWHDDLVGNLLIDAFLNAADRGVRVRLLIDDMALNSDKDIGAVALDAHSGVEVRVFNPFARKSARWLQFVTRFDEVSRRMHNKSFTADNQLSIVGGRNIGNEYFEADPDLAFADLDVLAVGPVVPEISSSFDLYWNSELSYPIASLIDQVSSSDDLVTMRNLLSEFVEQQDGSTYLQALRNSDMATRLRNDQLEFDWGDSQLLVDDPAKIRAARDQTQLHLITQLADYFDELTAELIIYSPYFVPGREGVEYFRELRARGVRVRILTNSLASTDVSAVHAGYAKYRKYLLQAGVELYEIDVALTPEQRRARKKATGGSSNASLHAKSFVLDRERVFIGSLNLDPRSVVENTEIGIMVESADIANDMADWFDENIDRVAFRLALETNSKDEQAIVWYHREDGVEERYTTEPFTGFWRRFGVGFLSLLPIESLL
jgi:putative cardiolipin synthase